MSIAVGGWGDLWVDNGDGTCTYVGRYQGTGDLDRAWQWCNPSEQRRRSIGEADPLDDPDDSPIRETDSPAPDEMCRRVADITQEIEVARRHLDRIASERAGIVQVLRAEGWSLGKIATATGLSRSRVAQIAE